MKSIKIIEELRKTNSRLEKIEILKTQFNNETFKKVLQYTYNPYLKYGVKKYNKNIECIRISSSMTDVFNLLDKLNDRELTGHAAVHVIEELISTLDPRDAEVFKLILNKNLNCATTTSTINKVWDNLIPEFKIAKAKGEANIRFITYPALGQLKGDGRRAITMVSDNNKVTYLTSSGKEDKKLNCTLLDSAFIMLRRAIEKGNKTLVFDGEIIMVNENGNHMDRKFSNGLLNRKKLDKKHIQMVKFLLWDVITKEEFDAKYSEVPYIERYLTLTKGHHTNSSITKRTIEIISSKEIHNVKEAKELAAEFISEGYEGAMLKNMYAPYEGKRTNNQIKIKAEREADLVVVDWQEGTGLMKGYLGALICESKNGKLRVAVGSGYSHADRGFKIPDTSTMKVLPVETELAKDKIIGKIITVKYNEIITKNSDNIYSLFLPRFVEVRNDKTEADEFEKIQQEL